MPITFELIGEAFKALTLRAISRRLGFLPSRYGGGYGGHYGNYGAGDLSLRHAVAQTGSSLDYENAAGDVLSNSIVAACVNAICQALPEAPILLEKRVGGNEFERVDSHAVLDLLHNPNPYLSEAELWGVTTAFERTRGEAFWYFEYGPDRTVPREIWFRAPEYVQVLSDTSRFISGYNITSESGQVVSLEESDVVHFRHQLSTLNPRAGWSPIQTGKRQIVGDNAAATYHSAILRNAGAASLIISLKDAAAAGEVTPGQIDEYVQMFKRKVVGEGSGAILGMDLPLDVHKVGFSPDEMALDRLLEIYESRLGALMGVNRRVINLGNDPTYENSKVALNDFWERTIIPMRRRHASTLSSQLLPLFGLDPAVYRLRFDFSEVEALRENVDALHARWRETFTAGGIDLFTFQEKIGLKPDESLRGRFVKGSVLMDEGEGGDEIKAGFDPNQPRDEYGRWTNGGGTPGRGSFGGGLSGGAGVGGSVSAGGRGSSSGGHRRSGGRGSSDDGAAIIGGGSFGGGSSGGAGAGSTWVRGVIESTYSSKPIPTPETVRKLLGHSKHPFDAAGMLLSQSVELPPQLGFLREALDALDKVHGDGDLATIVIDDLPVRSGGKVSVGKFKKGETSQEDYLGVTTDPIIGPVALIHETGHRLQDRIFDASTMDSRTEELYDDLMGAIDQSAAIGKLKQLQGKKTIRAKELTRGKTIDYKVDAKHVSYLLDPEERFSRAYAQYVAIRSGSLRLQGPIAAEVSFKPVTSWGGGTSNDLHYFEQWNAADFKKIEAAFDKLFLYKRWIKANGN